MKKDSGRVPGKCTNRLSLIGIFGVFFLMLGRLTASIADEPSFDWSTAKELHPGVQLIALEREYPNAEGLTCPNFLFFDPAKPRKLSMQAVRVDIQTPGLKWVTTGRADNWGESMPEYRGQDLSQFVVRTQRQTTRDFLQTCRLGGLPVMLAVNAAPWSPYQSGMQHPYADRLGLAIADGQLVSPPLGKRPSLVISDSGQPELRLIKDESEVGDVQMAISGFGFCLREGQPVAPDSVLHPRTGVGLCQENRYLVLLVIDGRQVQSQGATVSELGRWLLHLGSHNGLNLDGGGSTTMVYFDPSQDSAVLLNRPSFGERKNGNNFGFYFSAD